jgi:hypothetical protein
VRELERGWACVYSKSRRRQQPNVYSSCMAVRAEQSSVYWARVRNGRWQSAAVGVGVGVRRHVSQRVSPSTRAAEKESARA